MRILFLWLTVFLVSIASQAQKDNKLAYRCIPCGRDCDKEIYGTEGKCNHCGMELVAAKSIRFTEVSPESICAYIKQHPNTLLLDVRTKEEYDGSADPNFGTLKGAINIPIQELPMRLSELEKYKGKEILVFCSHSHRSPQAAYLLNNNGFKKVKNMSGGMSLVESPHCKK